MAGSFDAQNGPDLPAMLCSEAGLHRTKDDTDPRCDPRLRGAHATSGELGAQGRAPNVLDGAEPAHVPLRSQTTKCTDRAGVERDAILWSTWPERAPAGAYPTPVPGYYDPQNFDTVDAEGEVPQSGRWHSASRAAYIHGWAVDANEVGTHDADAWTGNSETGVDHVWVRKRNFNAAIDRFDVELPDGWDRLGTAGVSAHAYAGAPLVYTRHAYDVASTDAGDVGLAPSTPPSTHYTHALNAYATTEQTGKCIKVTPRFKTDNVPIVQIATVADPDHPNYFDPTANGFEAPVQHMPVCSDHTEDDLAFYIVVAPRETGDLQCGVVGNQPLPDHGLAPYAAPTPRYLRSDAFWGAVEYSRANYLGLYPPVDLPGLFASQQAWRTMRMIPEKPDLALPTTATTLTITGAQTSAADCSSTSGQCVDTPTTTNPLPRVLYNDAARSDGSGHADLMLFCHTAKPGEYDGAGGTAGTDVEPRVVEAFDVRVTMGASDNTYDQTSPEATRLRGPTLGGYPGAAASGLWQPADVQDFHSDAVPGILTADLEHACGPLSAAEGMRDTGTSEYTTAAGGTDSLGDWSGFRCPGALHPDAGRCERVDTGSGASAGFVSLRFRGGVFDGPPGVPDRCATTNAPNANNVKPRLAEMLHQVRVGLDTRMMTPHPLWPEPPTVSHTNIYGTYLADVGRHAVVMPGRPLHPGEEFEVVWWRTWPNTGSAIAAMGVRREVWLEHVVPMHIDPTYQSTTAFPRFMHPTMDNCVMFPDYPQWSADWTTSSKSGFGAYNFYFPDASERPAGCLVGFEPFEDSIFKECLSYYASYALSADIDYSQFTSEYSAAVDPQPDWWDDGPSRWAETNEMFRFATCKFRVREDALTRTGVSHVDAPVVSFELVEEINAGNAVGLDNYFPECFDWRRGEGATSASALSERQSPSYRGCEVRIVPPVPAETETCFYSTIETDYMRTVQDVNGESTSAPAESRAYTLSQRAVNCIKATGDPGVSPPPPSPPSPPPPPPGQQPRRCTYEGENSWYNLYATSYCASRTDEVACETYSATHSRNYGDATWYLDSCWDYTEEYTSEYGNTAYPPDMYYTRRKICEWDAGSGSCNSRGSLGSDALKVWYSNDNYAASVNVRPLCQHFDEAGCPTSHGCTLVDVGDVDPWPIQSSCPSFSPPPSPPPPSPPWYVALGYGRRLAAARRLEVTPDASLTGRLRTERLRYLNGTRGPIGDADGDTWIRAQVLARHAARQRAVSPPTPPPSPPSPPLPPYSPLTTLAPFDHVVLPSGRACSFDALTRQPTQTECAAIAAELGKVFEVYDHPTGALHEESGCMSWTTHHEGAMEFIVNAQEHPCPASADVTHCAST